MSGRETVRAFREAGGLAVPPPKTAGQSGGGLRFLATVLFVGVIGFLGVFYVLPLVPTLAIGALQNPVGLPVADIKAQMARVDAARNAHVVIHGAALTQAESTACYNASKTAQAAAVSKQRSKRELSGSHIEESSAAAAGTAAEIACIAATRPAHLCDTEQQQRFLSEIDQQSWAYDNAQKLASTSDEELLAYKKKYPGLSPIPLTTLRQDLDDMSAATTKSLEDTRAVIRKLSAAGIITVDAFRAENGSGALWSTYMKMIDGAQDGPSACPKA